MAEVLTLRSLHVSSTHMRVPAGGVILLAAVAAAPLGGCNKPTSESIQQWKTTQKGPDRLREALADHSVSPKLRAEAAVAMVDIGHAEEADTVIAGLPAADRAEISKTLLPSYEAAIAAQGPEGGERALAYRDALFSLRQSVPAEDQKRIDAIVIPVLENDLKAGKLRQGRHSIDKMLTAIGSESGAMLVRVLATDAPYAQAAELLAKVGDESARDKGAAALVARAPKLKTTDKRPELVYKALGALGGPTALKFLEEKVTSGDKEEALLATRALGERRDPAVLPFALKVAGDSKADKTLRDEMFGVVEGIGGLEAEKGLVGIISSDKDEIVRYRAFESILAARKADGIQPGLEAFPSSATYKKVDVDDLLVKLIEKQGATARPSLVKTLASRAPLARMTAAMALEQIGHAPDAPALEKLAGDSAPVKGFPAGETVGKQAARAAETVKKRP
jgi:HEAT repeat protein